MDRDSLERLLAEGLSLEEIGLRLGRPASTVGYWVSKHGLRAANADKFSPKGGVEEAVLRALIEEGLTVRGMSARLGVSPTTVRHWLRKYGVKTRRAMDRGAIAAGEPRPRYRVGTCPRHGRQRFVRAPSQTTYRCPECSAERVAARRRVVKEILVAESGGACAICGYARYLGALQFHHLDPDTKEFGIGLRGVTRSLERARAEARKCVLLCANCHAEVEGGIVQPPNQSTAISAANLIQPTQAPV